MMDNPVSRIFVVLLMMSAGGAHGKLSLISHFTRHFESNVLQIYGSGKSSAIPNKAIHSNHTLNLSGYELYENIALSGAASQYDTYGSLFAHKAIDGVTDSGSCTFGGGPEMWWRVVLPSQSYISKIQIYTGWVFAPKYSSVLLLRKVIITC